MKNRFLVLTRTVLGASVASVVPVALGRAALAPSSAYISRFYYSCFVIYHFNIHNLLCFTINNLIIYIIRCGVKNNFAYFLSVLFYSIASHTTLCIFCYLNAVTFFYFFYSGI